VGILYWTTLLLIIAPQFASWNFPSISVYSGLSPNAPSPLRTNLFFSGQLPDWPIFVTPSPPLLAETFLDPSSLQSGHRFFGIAPLTLLPLPPPTTPLSSFSPSPVWHAARFPRACTPSLSILPHRLCFEIYTCCPRFFEKRSVPLGIFPSPSFERFCLFDCIAPCIGLPFLKSSFFLVLFPDFH